MAPSQGLPASNVVSSAIPNMESFTVIAFDNHAVKHKEKRIFSALFMGI